MTFKFLPGSLAKFLVVLVLLPLVIIGVYLVSNQTVFKPKASDIKISLSPQSVSKNVGEEFSVLVNLDPGGVDVIGVETEVSFDKSKLEINNQSITVGSFGSAQKEIDQDEGKIKISAFSFDKANVRVSSPVSSNSNFLTLIFKAKNPGVTKINIVNPAVVDETGDLITLGRPTEVAVNVIGEESREPIVTSFNADYLTNPLNPVSGQPLVINIRTSTRNLNTPVLSIDGSLNLVEVAASGYTWRGTLPVGKHVVQLLANCKREPSLDCSSSDVGFNPYLVSVREAGTNSGNNYDLNSDTRVDNRDILELLNNFGVGGKGDFNNSGKVDLRDFATLFLMANP